jgi:helicase
MRTVNLGLSGKPGKKAPVKAKSVRIFGDSLDDAISKHLGGRSLRPIQHQAFAVQKIQSERRHALVCAPTNGGKSLVGQILAVQAAMKGKRAAFLTPLRAIAEEQRDQIKSLVSHLPSKKRPKVRLTTGDYRISDEFLDDEAPPEEIVVATYERFDALTRREDAADWLKTFSCIVIDEIHLLGDRHRGPGLEFLVALLRSLPSAPRLVMLSASVSNPADLATWLDPCTVVSQTARTPALHKKALLLEAGETKDSCAQRLIRKILAESPDHRVLCFVYQKNRARRQARDLAATLSGKRGQEGPQDLPDCMDAGAAWYHADLSQPSRAEVRRRFTDPVDSLRVVFATTALMMGVNLPATHVLLIDPDRGGDQPALATQEILQMLGRAGRGDREGTGWVLLDSDREDLELILEKIREEKLPSLTSSLLPLERVSLGYPDHEDPRLLGAIMGLLLRCGPITSDALRDLVASLWGGKSLTANLSKCLRVLRAWRLVWEEEGTGLLHMTALGKTSTRTLVPPDLAAGWGAFLRDTLSAHPDGLGVLHLSEVDLLLLTLLSNDSFKPLIRWNKGLDEAMRRFHSDLPGGERSCLLGEWFPGHSAPDLPGLFGLLDQHQRSGLPPAKAYQRTILSLHAALLLHDLAQGEALSTAAENYAVPDLEERRDEIVDRTIWLLHGLERLLEVPHFYHHLLQDLRLDKTQVKQIEKAFKTLSKRIFQLTASLRYASPLGALLRSIAASVRDENRRLRAADPKAIRINAPGEQTLQILLTQGIKTLKTLRECTEDSLVLWGIRKHHASLLLDAAH